MSGAGSRSVSSGAVTARTASYRRRVGAASRAPGPQVDRLRGDERLHRNQDPQRLELLGQLRDREGCLRCDVLDRFGDGHRVQARRRGAQAHLAEQRRAQLLNRDVAGGAAADRRQVAGQPARLGAQQPRDALEACGRHVRECDREHVEGKGDRRGMEVRRREHLSVREEHDRVVRDRVELDLDLAARVRVGVQNDAHDLRQTAERERILNLPSRARIVQIAPLEELPEHRGRVLLACSRTACRDPLVEDQRVRSEALTGERSGMHGKGEKPRRVDERERGMARRHRAGVAQRVPVLRAELDRGDPRSRQSRSSGQSARPRATPRHGRSRRPRCGLRGRGRPRRSTLGAGSPASHRARPWRATSSRTGGETPAPPCASPMQRAISAARHTGSGSGSPTPIVRPRTSCSWKLSSSARATRKPRFAPTPVFSPYTGSSPAA